VIDELLSGVDPTSEVELYTHDGVLMATNQGGQNNGLFVKNAAIPPAAEAYFSTAHPVAVTAKDFTSGADALITYADSPGYLAYKGNRWILLIETPSAVAFAPAASTSRNIVLFLLPIIFLTTLLSLVLLHRFIIRPVVQLTIVAEAIRGGDLQRRAEIIGEDEVGLLARSFNAVTDKLTVLYKEIKTEEARLIASINSLSIGFVMVDTRGNVILVNQVAQKLFRSDEITFNTMSGFFNTLDTGEYQRRVVERKLGYEMREVEFEDKFFRVLITPIVLKESNDEVIGSVILFEDISDEKRLDQSKAAFISIASHEMRTPLTIIRGSAELLLGDQTVKGNPDLASKVERVLRGSVRLLGIVNDFLDVQNLEETGIVLNLEEIDVPKLLKETIADFSKIAADKHISLSLEVPPPAEIPILKLDKFRLQQICVNLISNAIHYTKQGGVVVSVKKQGNALKINFSDTGVGIAPEDQAHLFKKFETGKAFLHSTEYGSGLGLYISRFLARLMGGDLGIEKSEPGVGSIFSLTLPLVSGKEKRPVQKLP